MYIYIYKKTSCASLPILSGASQEFMKLQQEYSSSMVQWKITPKLSFWKVLSTILDETYLGLCPHPCNRGKWRRFKYGIPDPKNMKHPGGDEPASWVGMNLRLTYSLLTPLPAGLPPSIKETHTVSSTSNGSRFPVTVYRDLELIDRKLMICGMLKIRSLVLESW